MDFEENTSMEAPDSVIITVLLETSTKSITRGYLIRDLNFNITFRETINKILFEKHDVDFLDEPSILEKIKEEFSQKECKIFCNGKEVQGNFPIKDYLIDINHYVFGSYKSLEIKLKAEEVKK